MNILIVYGTTEGQTRKICEHIGERLEQAGHSVRLHDSGASPADVDVGSFDAAIVAGSVHQNKHQESLRLFAIAHRAALQRLPTLFVSVSLSAAFEEGKADAAGNVSAFLKETGWSPTTSLTVAGALRFDRYDYFMEQIIRYVVLRGHAEGQSETDNEFTDWPALDRAIDGFVTGVGG